jgi:hypothetical protein
MGKQSLKDVSRKNAEKRAHLESMPFETTPAQRLMRSEMEAGLHKASAASAAVNPPSHELDSSVVSGGAPVKAGQAIDDAVGIRLSDGIVATEALAIINELGNGVRTGLAEWAIIQRMIEEGYHRGRRDGWHAAERR